VGVVRDSGQFSGQPYVSQSLIGVIIIDKALPARQTRALARRYLLPSMTTCSLTNSGSLAISDHTVLPATQHK